MLILKARRFAEEKGIKGYKLTFHVGKGGGQEVFYLHLHLLSEEKL
ncbi:MAG: HIT domain-containing protein [Patescibacteria group bacterium]